MIQEKGSPLIINLQILSTLCKLWLNTCWQHLVVVTGRRWHIMAADAVGQGSCDTLCWWAGSCVHVAALMKTSKFMKLVLDSSSTCLSLAKEMWWRTIANIRSKTIHYSIVDKTPAGGVELVHGRLKALFVQRKHAVVLFQSSSCQNLNHSWIALGLALGLKQTKAVHVVEGVWWSN